MKRIICMILALLMLISSLSMLGISAFAEDEDSGIYDQAMLDEMKNLKGVKYIPAKPVKKSVSDKYAFWFEYQNGDKLIETYKNGKTITYKYSESKGWVDKDGVAPRFREYGLDDAAWWLNIPPLNEVDKNYNVVGKHNYKLYYATFTVKIPVTVIPDSTKITKLTANRKGFTVKFKKQTKQTSGYQLQYSTSSKFSSKTSKTVSKSKTSYTVSGLKANKKYYVRIRTYKTVKGEKIYSKWSAKKSIKTK